MNPERNALNFLWLAPAVRQGSFRLARRFALALLLTATGWAPLRAADTLIATGSVWKYLDTGTNLGAAWRDLSFDDSAWASGRAQLGYGDGDEATVVSFGTNANAKYITTYFRHAFAIADPSSYTNLLVRLLRDDGGAVYLNGTEVFRSNMPTGSIANVTLASASVPAGDETSNFHPNLVSAALLVAGTNVVAVEIHQNAANSSDLSFDLELLGNFVNAPPTVTLTNPANGRAFRAGTNVTLNASASDSDGTVARVEFFAGATLLGTDATSPYSLVWSNVALGAYTLRAVATDNIGATATSAPVSIAVVTNVLPAVSLSSPTNNTFFKLGSNVTATAIATDADGGVRQVEFFLNGASLLVDTNSPFSTVLSNLTLGAYQLHAVATDNDGDSSASAVVVFTVTTNLPPSVNLTNPVNNALLGGPGDVRLNATASDADGSVTRVEFFEGANLLGADTTSPYSLTWSNVALGSYVLSAVATDNGGATRTSAPVNVTVKTNALPTASVTSPSNNMTFKAGSNVTFSASASDADGFIYKVEFHTNGVKLAEDATSPYSVVWSNARPGSYTLTAVAWDSAYATRTSAPVTINVVTNFLPAVVITSPTNNTVLGGPLDITTTATATDSDNGVALVEFFANDVKVGEDAVVPYGVVWSSVAIGDYVLLAVATDTVGGRGTSAPVNVTVRSNMAPGVALTSPTNNASFKTDGSITLTATATDADGIVRQVEFFANDGSLGVDTNSPFSLVWSNAPVGAYALVAVATDNSGAGVTSAPVTVFLVTNFAPAVNLTNPTNGTVLGGPLDVSLTATAGDSDGTVALVEFFADATKVGDATSGPPFSVVWSNTALGDYTLTAVATDNGGASQTSAPVALSIRSNLPPSVVLTNPRPDAVFSVVSNVALIATATDPDGGVRRVEFLANDTRLGEDMSPPFSFVASNLGPGVLDLRAVATDIAGAAVTSAPVRIIIVTNLLPTVALTNPPNNAVRSAREPLTLRASAGDPDGAVTRVEFFLGRAKVGESLAAPFSLTLSNLTAGAYLVWARATDNNGDTVLSAPLNLTLNNRRALIPVGATWKYLDNGTDQGAAWREPGFDDRAWLSGPAELGYGDGDEATMVSFGTNANAKYITTYFRHSFVVEDVTILSDPQMRLLRDDGAVVYLNGVEVFRSNMPTGAVSFATLASGNASDEDAFYPSAVPASLLADGANVVAVEIHQSAANSSDISFNFEFTAVDTLSVTRGPYLQLATPSSIVVRWRTDRPADGRVWFGPDAASLTNLVDDPTAALDHAITVSGLAPDTTYCYAVGTTMDVLAAGPDHTFTTAPAPGAPKPTRVWVLGDSGTGFSGQFSVRDAYYAFAGLRPTDLWLMLGDNVYDHGWDDEYGEKLFAVYPTLLRQSVLWPTIGNHDTDNLTSVPETLPYFDVFTMPAGGEAGGVPSGTERYYSFDYANVHFVSLDSQTSDRGPNGPMLAWLRQDLAANRSQWTIVTFHHPPYSKGNNDSDTAAQQIEMRVNVVPLLEAYGVDLVLCGHSHSYERSYCLDGHYGPSTTFSAVMHVKLPGDGRPDGTGAYVLTNWPGGHRGTVYAVAGSSGRADNGPLNHPAMFFSARQLGSLVLDVNSNRLDAKFVRETGAVDDYFTLIKVPAPAVPPVVSNRVVSTLEELPLTLALPVTDANLDPLTITILSAPTGGVLTAAGPDGAALTLGDGAVVAGLNNVVYAPARDFNGPDRFTFKASDGLFDSGAATVTINVRAINDAPSFTPGPDVAVNEDSGPGEFVAWATDIAAGPPNEAGQRLNFDVTHDHPTLFVEPPSVAPDGTLRFLPGADAFGVALVTVMLRDDGGRFQGGQDASAARQFRITVQPVNDAPSFVRGPDLAAEEDAWRQTVSGWATGMSAGPANEAAQALAFVVLPDDPRLFAESPAIAGDGTLTFLPAPDAFGQATITVRLRDDGGTERGGEDLSAPQQFVIAIRPVNDGPVADASATPLGKVISANNTNAVVVLDGSRSSDREGDALEFTWLERGTPIAAGMVTTPALGVGSHAITLRVSDGADADTDELTISVLTAGQAVTELIAQVNAMTTTAATASANMVSLSEKNRRPLLATLEAARDAFDRGSFGAGVNQLQAFQNKTRAQIAPLNAAVAATLIEAAQEIIAAFAGPGAPPRLSKLASRPDRSVKFTATGTAGRVYLIEASEDLQRWRPVASARARADGLIEFEDRAKLRCRFYRLDAR
jgi:hypothetical protein